MIQLFHTEKERLKLGVQGMYPKHLVEHSKDKTEVRHTINEQLTQPWIIHYFYTQLIRESNVPEDIVSRNNNLIEIFRTTIPLTDNSFIESSLSSWRLFIDSSYRDSDVVWYSGIRKLLNQDRFHSAIEQLELEMPTSNPQHLYQFSDHTKTLRKIPRVPIKLFFSLPGNEREKLIEVLRQAINNNPHNVDIVLLSYCFFKAWERTQDFISLAVENNRKDLEEWFYWIQGDVQNLGKIRRTAGDFITAFYFYDRAQVNSSQYKEIADWFLKESEFKLSYHFYYKAKEFETALDLLQNISIKEFTELTNLRQLSKGEKPFAQPEASRFSGLYQEEMETLKGFARIRAAESYKQVAAKARQHFDRETIETKYAFGELSEEEYQRLLKQLQERIQ